jgi:hypothetical protein
MSALPAEIFVNIVNAVPSSAAEIANVCRSWRRRFHGDSSSEPSFRDAVRSRYGVRKRPWWAVDSRVSWGNIFLAFSKESCHLCQEKHVRAGAYASLAAFAGLLPSESLMLFPVCGSCLVARPDEASMPIVVELDCLCDIFTHVKASDIQAEREILNVETGVIYNSSKLSNKSKISTESKKCRANGSMSVVYVKDILQLWPGSAY